MVTFKPSTIIPPSEEFPSSGLPTIFADGIMNLANTPQIAKCYLFRLDPGLIDGGKAQVRPCAQIIMQIDALVNIFAFLEGAIEKLHVQGVVSDQALETARKVARGA